jgi:hypothetical protein
MAVIGGEAIDFHCIMTVLLESLARIKLCDLETEDSKTAVRLIDSVRNETLKTAVVYGLPKMLNLSEPTYF